MKLTQFVREARKRAGLSQRELARRTGVSQPHLARVERGQVAPSFDLVRRLVRGCGFDLRMSLQPIDDSTWSVATTHLGWGLDERAAANQQMADMAREARDRVA